MLSGLRCFGLLAAATMMTAQLLGCGVSASAARVANGAQFLAGEPAYDGFFLDLHDAQVAETNVVAARIRARKPLTEAIGVAESADAQSTLGAVVKRTARGQRRSDVVASVEFSFIAERRRHRRLEALLSDVLALQSRTVALEPGVHTAFPDPARAERVRAELLAANHALEEMRKRTTHELEECDTLANGLLPLVCPAAVKRATEVPHARKVGTRG
jgi:hypothetical protein